jgi:hypothetical protein
MPTQAKELDSSRPTKVITTMKLIMRELTLLFNMA